MQEEKQREKSNTKKFKRIETVEHISSTFQSPFEAYYMSFRSLGSQKSNASNSVRIRAEMKKLQPLKAKRTKLKGNFAVAKSGFLCEMETFSLRNFAAHVACLRNPPECFQIFVTNSFIFFFFRYLLFKSPFSPCNPPMIGFLSQ